ncbi:MAG: LysM peptidoglycan-binding domain-containing protein [Flavobacterium sp.]|nr:MAG: LysM peptidoglycan-binding domain-containing protein [Flavobacterium sp.]
MFIPKKHNMNPKRRIVFFVLMALMFTCTIVAQESIKHTVVKGETITSIAQKYRVTPFDIYSMNPRAEAGIKENDVLMIPTWAKNPEQAKPSQAAQSKPQSIPSGTTHTTKAKETLYSIARQYNVTVDDLRNANPFLADGLKIGQVLKIPSGKSATPAPASKAPADAKPATQTAVNNTPPPSAAPNGKTIYHVVEPKETKFGISKKYGLTVAELERQNPAIVPGLQVGYKLSISPSGSAQITEKPKPTVTEMGSTTSVQTESSRTVKKSGMANYEVKPKETLYSLTQMFGISEAELIKLNPSLKEGVKVGMILTVPGRGSMISDKPKANGNLASTVTKEKKTLVMLLPFNADRIQGDTLQSVASRLKKDAFLNMTLDFYSGALMAIDSAKTLGINVDVKIYDSKESRASSDIENIVAANDLKSADAVIGPFYQQYAERTAELLNKENIPVVSPLSKEDGREISNLYQSMPSVEYGKRAIIDYMISKDGNIIVVSDPKRASNRDFITTNYPQIKFAQLSDNGSVVPDNLKAMFVNDKTNYVIIDSEKTGMILSTTNVLLNESANFPIQLAIIEPNETLDFEEVSMKRLTILKMLYPAQTRENNSPEAIAFQNAYKDKNKIFPSQYAVRGFDVTFDTLLRMTQEGGFASSAATDKTEQVESKFSYERKGEQGNINNGIYILQYDEDMNVKQVN